MSSEDPIHLATRVDGSAGVSQSPLSGRVTETAGHPVASQTPLTFATADDDRDVPGLPRQFRLRPDRSNAVWN